MKTTYLLIAAAAVAVGYLAANRLKGYQPFSIAYMKGAGMAG